MGADVLMSNVMQYIPDGEVLAMSRARAYFLTAQAGAGNTALGLTERTCKEVRMAAKALPPVEVLRQLLRYEPETGKLFWRERDARVPGVNAAHLPQWNGRFAGAEAFTASTGNGYRQGNVLRCHLEAHRVIWAIVNGEWPSTEIDHIDGNPANNRISNLRLATRRENMQNLGKQPRNTSGHVGAFWSKSKRRWKSQINTQGGLLFLGYFGSAAEAGAAYAKAKAEHHKFSPAVRE
jgi:hypothetical protein